MEGIIIRNMSDADLPQVHAIECQNHSSPWSINSFSHELGSKETILKTAVAEEQVIGYACIRSMLDITHILKITVIPRFRRMGIGTSLLHNALRDLGNMGKDTALVTLEVRESNIAAINMYKKMGFKENGRRKNYYKRPDEDALIMELKLTENYNKDF